MTDIFSTKINFTNWNLCSTDPLKPNLQPIVNRLWLKIGSATLLIFGMIGLYYQREEELTFEGNVMCKGAVKEGKLNGIASCHFPGGSYKGEFEDNEYHGEGTLALANGDYFKGIWKHAEFDHGVVRYTTSQREIYEGGWNNQKQEGYGTYTWPNATYIGDWKKGEKHGYGTYIKKQRVIHQGLWNENDPIYTVQKYK